MVLHGLRLAFHCIAVTTNLFQDSITCHYDITLLLVLISTYFDMSRNVSKSNFATDGAPSHTERL